MMRLILAVWWTLALFWMVSTQLGAEANDKAWPAKVRTRWPEVRGYGLSTVDAKQDAVLYARKEAEAFLRRLDPTLEHWKPSAEEVFTYFLAGPGSEGPEVELELPGLEPKKGKTWVLTFKTDVDLGMLRRMDHLAQDRIDAELRVERSQVRLLGLGKLIAALLIGLGAVTGYLRLRKTKSACEDRP